MFNNQELYDRHMRVKMDAAIGQGSRGDNSYSRNLPSKYFFSSHEMLLSRLVNKYFVFIFDSYSGMLSKETNAAQ